MKNTDIAENIEKIIRNNAQSQLAISGNWGSGKTTIIECIEDAIKDDFKIIKIELWNYEIIEESIFTQIVIDIMMELEFDEATLKELMFNSAKLISKNISKKIFSKVGVDLDSLSEDFKFVNKSWIWNEMSNYQHQLIESKRQLEYLLTLMKESFEKFLKKEKNPKNILIIFDDLDRCSENNIIKILTCLKNVLFKCGVVGLRFVTAINRKQISNILQHKDEEYIDKIFEKIIDLDDLTSFNNLLYMKKFGTKLDQLEMSILNKFHLNQNYRVMEKYHNICEFLKYEDQKYFVLWLLLLKDTNKNKFKHLRSAVLNDRFNNAFYIYLINYFSQKASNFMKNNKHLMFELCENWKNISRYLVIDQRYFISVKEIKNGFYGSNTYPFNNFIPFMNVYQENNNSVSNNFISKEEPEYLSEKTVTLILDEGEYFFDNDFYSWVTVMRLNMNTQNNEFIKHFIKFDLEYLFILAEM